MPHQISPYLIVGLALLAISVPILKAITRSTSLVLRSFDVCCTPQSPGRPLVHIVGRPAGVIAFVLTLLQLNPQTRLSATDSGIDYEAASLFGYVNRFIPLSRVASMSVGLRKPVGHLILAGLLLLLGVLFSMAIGSSIPLVAALVIAVLLVVHYFISKSVLFEIKSNAGIEISLHFRPGVIEGVPVDAGKARAAAGVIRDLILERAVGEYRESLPIGIGSQFANDPTQPVPPIQSARHSPPPIIGSVPPVVDGTSHTDGSCDEESARDALRDAVRLYKAGNREAAIMSMNRVIEEFPNTTAAATARANLTKMKMEPR